MPQSLPPKPARVAATPSDRLACSVAAFKRNRVKLAQDLFAE